MKRFLLALVVIGMTIGLSSCTKEYITNYLPGVSYVVPVKSNEWTLEANNVYRKDIPMKDLDKAYFEDGHVSVAISFDGPGNEDRYEIIPAEIFGYSFSSNYSIGIVRIYAKDISSGPTQSPDGLLVKIVLTDADPGN